MIIYLETILFSSCGVTSSAWIACLWHFCVANGEAAERPLVNKPCYINMRAMVDGCFFHHFFMLLSFINPML